MTVSTVSTLTNVKEITVTNEYDSEATITEVNNVITSMGWSLWDTVRNHVPGFGIRGSGATININSTNGGVLTLAGIAVASAGTGYSLGDIVQVIDGTHLNAGSNTAKFEVTALSGSGIQTLALISGGSGYSTGNGLATISCGSVFSPMHIYVYRAINANNTTYKYLVIRWDTVKWEIFTSCCESWNTATKVPTNETWMYGGSFPQGYDLRKSVFLIGATNRHFVLWISINAAVAHADSWGIWTAVFEAEEVESSEEYPGTARPPSFFWTNSVQFGHPYGASSYPTKTMVVSPRTLDNQTGVGAIAAYVPATSRGSWPPWNSSWAGATESGTMNTRSNYGHLADIYAYVNSWNTNKQWISPIMLDTVNKKHAFGRIYNLSVANMQGALPGDQFQASDRPKLDATGGWASASGTVADVIALNLIGGKEPAPADTSWGTYANGAFTALYTSQGTTVFGKNIQIGDTIWSSASDGVRTMLMSDGQGASTTLRFTSSLVTDIAFDGKRTIWAATATGVTKIDTETYATTDVALTNGGGFLNLDARYVYVASRTASTTPNLYMVNQSTNALDYTHTLSTVTLNTASGWATPEPDYGGSCFALSTSGGISTSTTVIRLVKITFNGSQPYNTTPFGSGLTNYTLIQGGLYFDRTSRTLWVLYQSSSAGRFYGFSATDLSATYLNNALTGSGTTSGNMLPQATLDYRAGIFYFFFRGCMYFGPSRTGQTASACLSRVVATGTGGNPWVANQTVQANTMALRLGSASWMRSNSVTIVGNIMQTSAESRIYWLKNGLGGSNYISNIQLAQSGFLILKG